MPGRSRSSFCSSLFRGLPISRDCWLSASRAALWTTGPGWGHPTLALCFGPCLFVGEEKKKVLLRHEHAGNLAVVWWFFSPLVSQQKKPETPLEPTNPFLEDESGEDNISEKDEDLDRVRLLIFICSLSCRNDPIWTISSSLLHPSSDRNWYRFWYHSNMQFTFLSNVVWFDLHLNSILDQANIRCNWLVMKTFKALCV